MSAICFPHVHNIDVQRAFGVVGGVARGIFDAEKFRQIKGNMEKNVVGADVSLRRAAVSSQCGRISTDGVGDALFHLFPGGEK